MASDRKNPFAPILLMVDGSETMMRAARRAVDLARLLDCKIHAVSVVDTDTLTQLLKGKILVQDEMEDFERDLTSSSERYLRMVKKAADEAGVEMETVLLKGGAHQTILAQQRKLEAGLVVLPGFSHSMTRRDLMTKAKQLILDEAPCPVLLVR
jgi:nucleotide-binding universal stress UspA family protein